MHIKKKNKKIKRSKDKKWGRGEGLTLHFLHDLLKQLRREIR